jgi:drug/metabolite transporter (DMT)-like permease
MLLGSLSFAVMGTMAHALGSTCSWQVIALVRTILAMLFGAILVLVARAQFVIWGTRSLWIRSIGGSFSLVGTFYAFTRLPVADVLTLTNLFPVWVALLSWPLLKERPTGQVWLSVASSMVGVILIQRPHFAEGNFASVVALACSLSTAIAMIGLHRLQGIDPRAIVVHFSGVGALFCLAALVLFDVGDQPEQILEGRSLLMLLGVGVTATLGQLLLTKAFAAGSPSKISVVGLTQIVFALALEVLWWGRSFEPATLLGMVLVVAPTAWLMSRTGAHIEEPATP